MEIKYQYEKKPGTILSRVVRWDDHFGLNDRSDYRFGINYSDMLVTGYQAYDILMRPIWTQDGGTFLDLMPVFVRPPKRIPNPNWGPGDRRFIDNPDYEAGMAAWSAAERQLIDLLRERLVMVCKVTFPGIPDTGKDLQWLEKVDGEFVPIQVTPGRFPACRRFVTVDDPDDTHYDNFVKAASAYGRNKQMMLQRLLAL